MTKERQALIDRFQKWLDTKPTKGIIAAQCATIAEEYHNKQLLIHSVVNCTTCKYQTITAQNDEHCRTCINFSNHKPLL